MHIMVVLFYHVGWRIRADASCMHGMVLQLFYSLWLSFWAPVKKIQMKKKGLIFIVCNL